MFCRKCGKAIPDDSKFCPYCGETVKLAEVEKENTSSEISETPHTDELSSNMSSVLSNGNNDITISPTPNENYPYGACSKCGRPLEADNIMICEKCAAEENQRRNLNEYINVNAKPNYDYHNKKSHKGAIIVFIFIGFFVLMIIVAAFEPDSTNSVSTSSNAVSSKTLSVRQQNILNAFNNTIQGDAEDTIQSLLKHPNTVTFNFNTDDLSVNNAIFTVTGCASYTNAKNKPAKDNFTVKIIATDKVYYPLYVKLGKTVSQDITRGTNSLGIATSYGKSLFNKTEGDSIFDNSDGNIIFISDELNEEMSLDEYNKIKTGMSYADVTEIVGSYGNQEAHSEIEGYSSTIFSWVGNGPPGSNANVTFVNGSVIAKGQVELQ